MLYVGHVTLDNIWQPRNYLIRKKVSEQHRSLSLLWSFHLIHFNSLALNPHWSKHKLLNRFFPHSKFLCVSGRPAHMSLGVLIWQILVWFLGQWFTNIPSCVWKLPGWLVTFRFRCFTPDPLIQYVCVGVSHLCFKPQYKWAGCKWSVKCTWTRFTQCWARAVEQNSLESHPVSHLVASHGLG